MRTYYQGNDQRTQQSSKQYGAESRSGGRHGELVQGRHLGERLLLLLLNLGTSPGWIQLEHVLGRWLHGHMCSECYNMQLYIFLSEAAVLHSQLCRQRLWCFFNEKGTLCFGLSAV
mmetsp:Transcript_2665/g.5151  ORF Transcript_2665/g.5151 Transcript_2665/m.5151 type:complete len:116 (+) Transcript_2665:1061-1408(+)